MEEYMEQDEQMPDFGGVLFWPNGTVEVSQLEYLLLEANDRKLSSQKRMPVITHTRTTEYGAHNPEYENIQSTMSVAQLRELYTAVTKQPFNAERLRAEIITSAIMVPVYNSRTKEMFVIDIGS